MELALNLVWLFLALGLLLTWGVRVFSFREEHRVATAAIALACVICLLFPVISITDDLNSSAALCEARTLIKKLSLSLDAAGALLSAVTAVSSVRHAAWREVNLHADVFHQLHELYASNLSRRPPPALA
jgi:FtsH-binding integral membrane protein